MEIGSVALFFSCERGKGFSSMQVIATAVISTYDDRPLHQVGVVNNFMVTKNKRFQNGGRYWTRTSDLRRGKTAL